MTRFLSIFRRRPTAHIAAATGYRAIVRHFDGTVSGIGADGRRTTFGRYSDFEVSHG